MLARRFLASIVSLAVGASPALAAGSRSAPRISAPSVSAPVVPLALPTLPALSSNGLDASHLLPAVDRAAYPQFRRATEMGITPAAVSALEVRVQDAQAAVPAAHAALGAVHRAAMPESGLAAEPQALDAAWDAKAPGRAVEPVAPGLATSPTSPSGLAPASPRRRAARWQSAAAGFAVLPAAAAGAPAWMTSAMGALHPYLVGGAVLGATWAVHKASRALVNRMAKRGKWNATTTDNVRFGVSVVTWLVGAGVGLKLAGIATTTILTTYGVAITLAVRKTVANLVQAVLILVQRPFVVEEKIRIGDVVYRVDDMQLQHVRLQVLGRLAKDAPAADKVEKGVVVKPLADIDPLGREIDEKGNRFALVRETMPGPESKDAKATQEFEIFTYSQLAALAVTLFRPYSPGQSKKLERLRLKEELDNAKRPVSKLVTAVQETGARSLVRAALWMALALALIPLLPVVQAWLGWKFLALIMPYVHGLATFVATRNVANFGGRLVPVLFAKFGRSQQAAVVARLAVELAVWGIGLSATMGAIGVQWDSVVTSLGVTAAAMTAAQTDILNNFAQAFLLRVYRPFDIGETVRLGGEVGVVEEMGMFYVVLRPASGLHVVVPYGAIDAKQLGTYESGKEETK